MHVLVTGATGFIGQHLVTELLAQRHNVTVLVRNPQKIINMQWVNNVRWITHDLHGDISLDYRTLESPDVLIHLAWSGLPNYQELFHFEVNLPKDYDFISSLIKQGLSHVLITGTCLEYGLKNGPLDIDTPADPQTAYALAKHTLHMQLRQLQSKHEFCLQWARLFYIYGIGQNPKSILSQLTQAIKNGDTVFNMSKGEQLRDYLTVESVAEKLCLLLNDREQTLSNICSGQPISVRALVENYLSEHQAHIQLNLGHYPYPNYEAIAFWGVPNKNRINKKISID